MMPTCRQIAEMLHDYLVGDLPPEQARILEMHLVGCVDCFRYLDAYRRVISLGERLPPVPMPEELVRRLRTWVG